MLTALFESPLGEKHDHVGPEAYFWSEGETLKKPNGQHIAVHRGGLWQVGNDAYIAISFQSPVMLAFDDPTTGGHAEFGPFPRIRLVNGSIWIKKDDHVELLAHFSDVNWVWTVYPVPTLKASQLTIRAAPTA